jgi:MFS family permease
MALAVNFSPEDMRGRYMAIYDLGWTIPSTLGPAAAGLILDNFNPDLLWIVGGLLCAIAAVSFLSMHLRLGAQERFSPEPVEQKTELIKS